MRSFDFIFFLTFSGKLRAASEEAERLQEQLEEEEEAKVAVQKQLSQIQLQVSRRFVAC